MSPLLIVASLAFALSLGAGQLMFKLAADDMRDRAATSLVLAVSSGWLWGALVLYAFSTALWIWILSQTPLSRAYPFALLGAAIVPLLSTVVLDERLSPSYILGMAMILAGLSVIQVWR